MGCGCGWLWLCKVCERWGSTIGLTREMGSGMLMKMRLERKKNRGLFVVLEGVDGAGTTTQAKKLVAALQSHGMPVHGTFEPSSGPIGQWTRQLLKDKREDIPPRSMALLFAADRHHHVENEILPALLRGTHVICDRYMMSSFVYQQATGVPRSWLLDLHRDLLLPDLTFFLRVSPEKASARRAQRHVPLDLYEADDFQKKASDFYEQEILMGQEAAQGRLLVLDGHEPIDVLSQRMQEETFSCIARD